MPFIAVSQNAAVVSSGIRSSMIGGSYADGSGKDGAGVANAPPSGAMREAADRHHHYTMTRAILARFLTALQNILQRFLPSAQEFAIIAVRNTFVAGS